MKKSEEHRTKFVMVRQPVFAFAAKVKGSGRLENGTGKNGQNLKASLIPVCQKGWPARRF